MVMDPTVLVLALLAAVRIAGQQWGLGGPGEGGVTRIDCWWVRSGTEVKVRFHHVTVVENPPISAT